MNAPARPLKKFLAYALSALMASPYSVLAQVTDDPSIVSPAGGTPIPSFATDISSGPLAAPATSVKPNILLILDDSGSMKRGYTPDYVVDNSNVYNAAATAGNTPG